MKIIDYEIRGSCVRFYLGKDDDTDYHGDDWNDRPYDCNAGTVYKEYITGYADLVFPLDSLVLEPCDGVTYCRFTKDDMKNGTVPCVVVVPAPMPMKKPITILPTGATIRKPTSSTLMIGWSQHWDLQSTISIRSWNSFYKM